MKNLNELLEMSIEEVVKHANEVADEDNDKNSVEFQNWVMNDLASWSEIKGFDEIEFNKLMGWE